MRRNRSFWIGAAVLGVALLAVVWWLGSPLFLDRTVDEAFPAAAPTEMAMDEAMEAEDDMTMATEEAMAEEAIDAEDDMEMATEEAMAAEEMAAEDEMKMATEAAMVAENEMRMATEAAMAMVTPTPSGPAVLLAGAFRDVDSVHRGSGSATIYQLPDGSRTLRFEAFEVTNGPDLYVLLVPRRDPTGDLSGAVELAALKGNVGDQNYELPPDLDLSGEWSVLIWCKAFNVNFSIAELDPAMP